MRLILKTIAAVEYKHNATELYNIILLCEWYIHTYYILDYCTSKCLLNVTAIESTMSCVTMERWQLENAASAHFLVIKQAP